MDVFRLGFRSIVGITMPGTIIVFSVLFGLWSRGLIGSIPKDLGAGVAGVLTIALFLVSYAIGTVLSLRAARRVDRLSAFLSFRLRRLSRSVSPDYVASNVRAAADWKAGQRFLRVGLLREDRIALGLREEFPYPCFSLVRLGQDASDDMFHFYWDYLTPLLQQVGYTSHFLNYCKMAVYARDSSAVLSAEIQEAEGRVRFLAGAFDAFVISGAFLAGCSIHTTAPWQASVCILLLSAVLINVLPEPRFTKALPKVGLWPTTVLISPAVVATIAFLCLACHVWYALVDKHATPDLAAAAIACGALLLAWGIISHGRLRDRRLSEVTSVLDAFYLTLSAKK